MIKTGHNLYIRHSKEFYQFIFELSKQCERGKASFCYQVESLSNILPPHTFENYMNAGKQFMKYRPRRKKIEYISEF